MACSCAPHASRPGDSECLILQVVALGLQQAQDFRRISALSCLHNNVLSTCFHPRLAPAPAGGTHARTYPPPSHTHTPALTQTLDHTAAHDMCASILPLTPVVPQPPPLTHCQHLQVPPRAAHLDPPRPAPAPAAGSQTPPHPTPPPTPTRPTHPRTNTHIFRLFLLLMTFHSHVWPPRLYPPPSVPKQIRSGSP
jgi:hypothetical protein